MFQRKTVAWLLLMCGAVSGQAFAAERPEIDLRAWKQLPVFHNGRIMPLDTFARSAVELICGRQKPTLGLENYYSEEQLSTARFTAAREVLGGTEARSFDPAELLLSWLLESDNWEEVPFLVASNSELRETILDVPATGPGGEHLKHVSPRDVEDSDAFYQHLEKMAADRRKAEQNDERYEPTGLDKEVDELYQAHQLFRQLTFDAMLDGTARRAFAMRLRDLLDTWGSLEPQLEALGRVTSTEGSAGSIASASQLADQILDVARQGRLTLDNVEPNVAAFADAANSIAAQWGAYHRKFSEQPPETLSDEQRAGVGAQLERLAGETATLAERARLLHDALYQNREWLRVVPALNAAALEVDRDTSDESQPWLDLQTLLYGSDRALRDYPHAEVQAVRNAFERMRAAYLDRARRPNDFANFMGQFSDALRALADKIEPLRRELPTKQTDEDLLAYTAYPPEGFTLTEMRYNRLTPFTWSWVISLLATACFALSFGVVRRSMFWVGIVLMALGIAWTAYGFSLRVTITGWAPVTNMYETVIYVPLFVSVLGLWFTLLPVTWPGVKNAWRLSGMPGLWEAPPLTGEQQRLFSPSTWARAAIVLAIPRLGLMWLALSILAIQPYAAGGRTIINLLPNIDVGQSMPTFNDLMTWAVGLAILIPTVWYLPRAVIAAVLSPVLVPLSLRRDRGENYNLARVYERLPFAGGAAFVAFLLTCLASYTTVLDRSFSPLQPVLRDNFWLTIHVLTIVSSYGAGALAWILGNIAIGYYLFGTYAAPAARANVSEGFGPAGGGAGETTLYMRPPEATAVLGRYIYSAVQVAVLLLAAGTILGGLWADVSWGRFWGWDPKEVWALISLLVYVAILHGRFAGWVGNFGLATGTVIGATAITMSWYGVNFWLGAGLHSYGFGTGGVGYVLLFVGANWAYVGLAALRYWFTVSMPMRDQLVSQSL